jgi:hypothetical protein
MAERRVPVEERELESRPAGLITADESSAGLDVFARRLVEAWHADLETVPDSTMWGGA